MQNKLMKWKESVELKKASKKGAVSVETIVVSGLILALAVAITVALSTTFQSTSDGSNEAIVDAGTSAMTQSNDNLKHDGSGTVTYSPVN